MFCTSPSKRLFRITLATSITSMSCNKSGSFSLKESWHFIQKQRTPTAAVFPIHPKQRKQQHNLSRTETLHRLTGPHNHSSLHAWEGEWFVPRDLANLPSRELGEEPALTGGLEYHHTCTNATLLSASLRWVPEQDGAVLGASLQNVAAEMWEAAEARYVVTSEIDSAVWEVISIYSYYQSIINSIASKCRLIWPQ